MLNPFAPPITPEEENAWKLVQQACLAKMIKRHQNDTRQIELNTMNDDSEYVKTKPDDITWVEPDEEMMDFWLSIGNLAGKSNDPWKKVGCRLTTQNGTSIVDGYNTIITPNYSDRISRRPLVQHAEVKLLHNWNIDQPSSSFNKLWITLFPCVPCMHLLPLMFVTEIHFTSMYMKDLPAVQVAKEYGIQLFQYPINVIPRNEPRVIRTGVKVDSTNKVS